jgi:hypothetical protein
MAFVSSIASDFAQHLFLVVKQSTIAKSPKLSDTLKEKSGRPLAIVHPRAYAENVARGKPPMQLARATLGVLRRLMTESP